MVIMVNRVCNRKYKQVSMITTVDVETSSKNREGGYDPSPFHPDNILVSVGINGECYFTTLRKIEKIVARIQDTR